MKKKTREEAEAIIWNEMAKDPALIENVSSIGLVSADQKNWKPFLVGSGARLNQPALLKAEMICNRLMREFEIVAA